VCFSVFADLVGSSTVSVGSSVRASSVVSADSAIVDFTDFVGFFVFVDLVLLSFHLALQLWPLQL
jgi:hypothetical protein